MNDPGEERFPFADLALSRRLEMVEARANADFVESRARVSPESGACWKEVAGAYAMYDGLASPLTQTFGLGLFETVTGAELATIEEFYRGFGAPVFHEISPLSDPALLPILNERGYRPIEFTNVMVRPIRRGLQLTAKRNEEIRVRLIQPGEQELWARTAARGWSELTEFADLIFDLLKIGAMRPEALSFLAESAGEPIAGGALCISDGVGLLAGASTIPERRKLGAQLALLENRMQYAAELGCDLAMICALPGSGSQRNAERHGFRIAYTRVKWNLNAS
ncbi:MAG TPA: GNAT family N-acetyltransferase [Blastocatellia bacterium]|nr:GNAT family N-acetyltransferase [Blastocatellia bacterium]